MSYKNIYKTITRALETYNVNNTLDVLEATELANRAELEVKKALTRSMMSVVTEELTERALTLTRKANTNRLIVDMYANEMEYVEDDEYEELSALLLLSANAGGQAALNRLDSEATFDLKDTSYITSTIAVLLGILFTSNLDFVAGKVEEARGGMLTVQETMEFLGVEITANANMRAELTVKNEIAKVVGDLEFEVFKRAGTSETKWVTVMDERVCPICMPMEGQVRTLGTPFTGGDGSSAIHPPIHIRCRCFLEPLSIENLGGIWTGK